MPAIFLGSGEMTNLVSRRAMLALLGFAPAYSATSAFAADVQDGWRWCRKCQGLWFAGNRTRGACPSGGGHQQTGSGNYRLLNNSPGSGGQRDWRWCRKCQGLWFSGNQTDGICPAGGAQTRVGSGDYTLTTDSGQRDWRWCRKCQGLWFAGNRSDGICPGGGAHSQAGSGDSGLNHGCMRYFSRPGRQFGVRSERWLRQAFMRPPVS